MLPHLGMILASAALLTRLGALPDDPLSEAAILREKPLGPYVKLTATQRASVRSFRATDRFVATYYFFWYDYPTGEHFRNADGSDALVDHPLNPSAVSYRSAAWHRKELLDLMGAGIDVIVPVYWGAPPDKAARFEGHYAGIAPLVEAAQRLIAEGKKPPRIGLFYDTSSLSASGNIVGKHVDLSVPDGKAWLYATIRDWFSAVPPALWAAIDGKPIVFLYSAGGAKAGTDDPAVFDYVRTHFARDFGGVAPYLVAEHSWVAPADNGYDWGAAFAHKAYGVAAIGPGYDDSSVPGRTSPKIDRRGGALYRERWEHLLSLPPATRPKIAIIETWNELHEGTDICETREYGRKYIDLTRRYAALWRAGAHTKPISPFAGLKSASITFGPEGRSAGVRLVENGDGLFGIASAQGSGVVETKPNPINGEQFLYINVDDGFYWEASGPVTVELECLDQGGGALAITYDSTDARAQFGGTYKTTPTQPRGDTGRWRVFSFRLTDARFANRQNSFTDFRISAGGTKLVIRRITLRKG